ncbi:MAG: FAD-binding oxidoreductase [Mycobacteriales bacterium]
MTLTADPAIEFELARTRLRSALADLPDGAPVRLAKRTSNLFRPRASSGVGLDVTGFDRVLDVDAERRVAEVGGMTTYEQLVAATLAQRLMPLVVPQLRTITLGGAVTGLGIESSSFYAGMPHESVREMEILTGSGEVVIATPEGEHAQLFRAFPNSYGSLGYALRLRIELAPVADFVELTHLRFDSANAAAEEIGRLCAPTGPNRPDFVDGVAFSPSRVYLTVGRFTDVPAAPPSDYTGQAVYYRSIEQLSSDVLTTHDYLWRWDTDWFWCSRAFGAQHPLLRRLWPARLRRSDVYWRLAALDERLSLSSRLDRLRGAAPREKVIQDVEIPLPRLGEFLAALDQITGLRPVWLCPIRSRPGSGPWPLYPLQPDQLYVNVGFWGAVAKRPGEPPGARNRAVEEAVARCDGVKSLYSTAYYCREEFYERYGGAAYSAAKARYDPDGRLADLYEKVIGGR